MGLKVAVQMDPIERINIRGDSTFALLLEAQARGFPVAYYTPDQLAMRDGTLFARVRPLSVVDRQGEHYTLGEARRVELAGFDVVLMRQDPPFDLAYVAATHLLERIHPKTLVINDPGHVRNAPEKLFVIEFADLMPPTLITRDRAEIKQFHAEQGEIVMKPLFGAGGAAQATELTVREREICARLGPALRQRGLLFVGIDVIDGFLTEINVTSPTGIRAVRNFGGPDIAALIWDKIEAMRRK